MRPLISPALQEGYDAYPRVEAAFGDILDESLHPRGPELLYEIAVILSLPRGASVLDLGFGEGRHSIRLAHEFGFAVHGIDAVRRHIEVATEALEEAEKASPGLSNRVRFELGVAEDPPLADAGVDLIWCRETLYHVEALEKAFAECRRVLRSGGRMLISQAFATDRLEPKERERLWAPMGGVPANADPLHLEAAFVAAGFEVEQRIELAGEWDERAQEETGRARRHLLHAPRLLRDPQRYIAKFGRTAYDIKLADCLWHIYHMIGKLSTRVYLLKAPRGN